MVVRRAGQGSAAWVGRSSKAVCGPGCRSRSGLSRTLFPIALSRNGAGSMEKWGAFTCRETPVCRHPTASSRSRSFPLRSIGGCHRRIAGMCGEGPAWVLRPARRSSVMPRPRRTTTLSARPGRRRWAASCPRSRRADGRRADLSTSLHVDRLAQRSPAADCGGPARSPARWTETFRPDRTRRQWSGGRTCRDARRLLHQPASLGQGTSVPPSMMRHANMSTSRHVDYLRFWV